MARLPAILGWHAKPALLAAVALLLSGAPPDAWAQAKLTRSALIVGVSVYASPEVPRLAGVTFDIDSARAIARTMDIPESQTVILRDAQATKAGILEALERLAASVAEGGRVLVYFSGHGTRWYEPAVQGCKEGLLAYDRQTITNEEIAQRTRRMSALADKVIVLFDACHSDGVSSHGQRTRAIAGALTPKFFLKDGADAQACSRPSNVKTRGLLAESTRLGALQENFVQITSSRADEVSFDEAERGGIATQSVRDCLLGEARDLDASGAVSIGEIEQCAQAIVDRKLKPYADLTPHHITVTGNRNIVPMTVGRLPATPAASTSTATTAPLPQQATVIVPALPTAAALAEPAQPTPDVAPVLASLATLRDIDAQRTPRRRVDVKLSHSPLKIGKDPLDLTITSSHDGYAYVVLLGSDRKSFYLLFPNGLDRDNAIKAKTQLKLPRPHWSLLGQGPAGTDHLLVLVADTPRDLSVLAASRPDPATPFTYALNDLPGRRALIDFLAGRGVTGTSENFGSRLLSIQELE